MAENGNWINGGTVSSTKENDYGKRKKTNNTGCLVVKGDQFGHEQDGKKWKVDK